MNVWYLGFNILMIHTIHTINQWCIVLKKIILELRKINLHGNRRPFFLSWLYYFFFAECDWYHTTHTTTACLKSSSNAFLIFVKKFNTNVNTKTVSEHSSAVYNNFIHESVFSLICVNYAVCTCHINIHHLLSSSRFRTTVTGMWAWCTM